MDTFWKLNPRYMELYHDDYEKRMEEKLQMMEYQAWINGFYVHRSIVAAFCSDCNYPDRPLSYEETNEAIETPEDEEELTEEQKIQAQKELLARLQIMQCNFESTHNVTPAIQEEE